MSRPARTGCAALQRFATPAPGLGVQKYGAASPYVTAVGGVFNGEIGNDVLQAGVCGHFLRTMPIGRQLMLLIA